MKEKKSIREKLSDTNEKIGEFFTHKYDERLDAFDDMIDEKYKKDYEINKLKYANLSNRKLKRISRVNNAKTFIYEMFADPAYDFATEWEPARSVAKIACLCIGVAALSVGIAVLAENPQYMQQLEYEVANEDFSNNLVNGFGGLDKFKAIVGGVDTGVGALLTAGALGTTRKISEIIYKKSTAKNEIAEAKMFAASDILKERENAAKESAKLTLDMENSTPEI